MLSFSWEYVFRPREAQWWVSVIFILVGIGCGLVLPAVLPQPSVQELEDFMVAIWILRILGAIFFLIGAAVLVLTMMKLPEYLVHTIGGALGALSFGIPATFALPFLLVMYDRRPNFLFAVNDSFGTENRLIGVLFSTLGVLTLIGTYFLARYQLKNKAMGWSWTWNSDDKK